MIHNFFHNFTIFDNLSDSGISMYSVAIFHRNVLDFRNLHAFAVV